MTTSQYYPSSYVLENICIFSLVVSGDTIIHFDPFQNILKSESKDSQSNITDSTWSKIIHVYPGPSPGTFCFAILLWLLTFNVYYRLHKKDKYQDHVLAVTTVLGFLSPAMWGLRGGWYLITLKSALPTMLFAGLVASTMGHAAGRRFVERRRKKMEVGDLPK